MEQQRETVVAALTYMTQQLIVSERFEMLVMRHCVAEL
jgi:hypothetical protein